MISKAIPHLVGFIVWGILFGIGSMSKDYIQATFIASILLSSFYLIWFLIRFGLMDKTITSIRNIIKVSDLKNKKREKLGMDPINRMTHDEMRQFLSKSNWIVPLIIMFIYIITAIVAVIIYYI